MSETGESEADQAKVCAICKRADERLCADHCHATGAVREWLCGRCNMGLGLFLDDPVALRAAAAYVERHRANPLTQLAFMRSEVERHHPRMHRHSARRELWRRGVPAANQGQ